MLHRPGTKQIRVHAYLRPNPRPIEDPDELRIRFERVMKVAARRFRQEQMVLVAAGIVDGTGDLLDLASVEQGAGERC